MGIRDWPVVKVWRHWILGLASTWVITIIGIKNPGKMYVDLVPTMIISILAMFNVLIMFHAYFGMGRLRTEAIKERRNNYARDNFKNDYQWSRNY